MNGTFTQQIQFYTQRRNLPVEQLASLANLPRKALSGHLRDRLVEHHAFPLVVHARCLMVGERVVLHPGVLDALKPWAEKFGVGVPQGRT